MIKLIAALILVGMFAMNAKSEESKVKPRYREGKKIDFESLLIEGEKKKPDYSVVTGNLGEKDLGLLRLRPDFTDTMADDAGEEVLQ